MKKGLKVLLLTVALLSVVIGAAAVICLRGMADIKALSIVPVDVTTLADGEYPGSYCRGRWCYHLTVTVKAGRITAVTLTDDKMKMFDKVNKELIGRIIARQTVDVDAATHATVTSKALLKAAENALSRR